MYVSRPTMKKYLLLVIKKSVSGVFPAVDQLQNYASKHLRDDGSDYRDCFAVERMWELLLAANRNFSCEYVTLALNLTKNQQSYDEYSPALQPSTLAILREAIL